MPIQRYVRRPIPAGSEEELAARYTPGEPLDDLRTIARMIGAESEVAEVVFPSGKRVLLAWYMNYPETHPAEPDYVTVEAGEYLAFSTRSFHLYASDDANWQQFYDLVPEG